MFDEILKNKSWIIEDVGRKKFIKGREEADIIYYIKLSRLKSYIRVTKRWIKQRLKLEAYNHPPTFKQLLYFISTVNTYYSDQLEKLKSLEKYQDKLIFINKKVIKKLKNDKLLSFLFTLNLDFVIILIDLKRRLICLI